MKSWLVFAHVIDSFEQKDFDKNFKKCKRNLDENTSVYVLKIYNKKIAHLYYITKNSYTLLLRTTQKNLTLRRWLGDFVDFIKKHMEKNENTIKAISYYGHGGSVIIGPWVDPLMGISQFVSYIVKPFSPLLISMDSCYMGAITSMYECAHYCKFAVASASWHPDLSVSSLKTFGKLPQDDDDSNWKQYTKSLSCEFNVTGRKPKYSCLLPLDLRNLVQIVSKIRVLKLNNNSNLKLSDPQQFDLYLAIDDENVKQEIQSVLINKKCLEICPKRINGISVREPDSRESWNKYYVKTKWSKAIKNIKIITEEDKPRKKSTRSSRRTSTTSTC
jgi:hypothetical protein